MADGRIYSATYSGVPVYELKLNGDSVMRRRSDDWINATHILKVSGFDKPARTRILEREVQKGVHEKVQGGYGKYQGTWIPLPDGRLLAERNNILDKLSQIFDFVPGDHSPPPAPKHTTAASRSKASRAPRTNAGTAAKQHSRGDLHTNSFKNHRMGPPSFSHGQQEAGLDDDDSIEQTTLESSSMLADEDMTAAGQPSRKRRRGISDGPSMTITDQEHILYGDQLLDYFMTVGDAPEAARIQPPEPSVNFQVDRPIDDSGNTALHWACAMGDLEIIKDLLRRGANVQALSVHEETPLVRAVLFTNNYEKTTMPALVNLLHENLTFQDWFGATIFHHIAETARSKGKWKSSRYYCEVLLQKFRDTFSQHELGRFLSYQDSNGDTAALVAARNGAFRLVSLLIYHCPDAGDLVNQKGETASKLVKQAHHPEQFIPQSSSPAATHRNDQHDSENAVAKGSNNPVNLPRSSSPATSTLLSKIGAIMEDANKKLTQAYGSTKIGYQGPGNDTNPAAFFELLELDRQNIKKQSVALSSKESESGPIETHLGRYEQTKRRHESFLEQSQRDRLAKRLATTNHTVVSETSQHPSSPISQELTNIYHLARELSLLQKARRTIVGDLIQQKADAGVSSKFDVHRKLVALATGLKEEELDPMSAELAETLEFERMNGKAFDQDSPEPDTPQQILNKELASTSMSSTATPVDVQ